ncbi:phosphotransferase [Clostridium polynesiense]|uniref:phosphotransferase n=1 Tax=Clostridium polynesiense TaxID=1325933 RepID=UPI00058B7A84|nr:phosphotransferase [Clostridium polynesiense]
MNSSEIIKSFGFSCKEEPASIYPFSPVYKITEEKSSYIIKKTQRPLEKAQRLMEYTEFLKSKRINIVTPVKLRKENPQSFEEDVYVVYPFIEGYTYSAKDEEIYEAGKLLGSIHYHSPKENIYKLYEYDVYDFFPEEVEDSIKSMKSYAEKVNYSTDWVALKGKLLKAVEAQEQLKNVVLPFITTPHDYKANNLIYTPEPYLIDPDNAGWIPRIFDLALSLLLFHNELSTAPQVIFTPQQWKTFMMGYNEYILLTELEKQYWSKALEHVFLDEVMWLMAEVEEDWYNPSQVKLFHSLIKLLFDSSKYEI